MHEKYLVIYPRGFVGFSSPGLNKESNISDPIDSIIKLRYNNTTQDKVEQVYNLNITKLYKATIDGVVGVDKLVFARSVMIEAIRNFETLDLSDWIELNKKCKYFTRHHQNFVLDTLRFIKTGRRDTSLRTWDIVIRKNLVDEQTSVYTNPTFDKQVNQFFNSTGNDDKAVTNALNRIIPEWLSRRGGLEDLLLTLNILFGKQYNK